MLLGQKIRAFAMAAVAATTLAAGLAAAPAESQARPRGHHMGAVHHGGWGHAPRHFRGGWARPRYAYRPVYRHAYRPRPAFWGPVWGYGFGPRCVLRKRLVATPWGWRTRLVRRCYW